MSNFERAEIITNLENSPLIATTKIFKDRIYITLINGDRRDELSINLTNGIMFIKKLQNGLYKETATKLENLVNEINF